MANKRISDLNSISGSAVAVDNDYLPIVDVSEAGPADRNKRITVSQLIANTPAFAQSGTGSITETVLDVLRRIKFAVQWGSLSQAITAVATGTIRVTSSVAVSSNTTVPATITLRFEQGGKIVPASGVTVTINGHVEAGAWQIFDHSSLGTVTGAIKAPCLYPEWWGAVGDGSTNDSSAFASAITAAAVGGGTVAGNPTATYKLNTGQTVPNGVVLDLRGALIKPGADVDLITLQEGCQLKGFRGDTTAISYSSEVLKLSPTADYIGTLYPQPWVDGYQCKMTAGAGTGTHVLFDASSHFIQEAVLSNIACYHGENAIKHVATAGSTEWSNGNTIKGFVAHDPVYAILESTGGGEIAGNVYHGMVERNSQNAEVQLNSRSKFDGILFDNPKITYQGNENNIVAPESLVTTNSDTGFTDNGVGNRLTTADIDYYDGRSVTFYDDARNGLSAPGRVEFREFFFGGTLDSRWTTSGTGSTSFDVQTNGGASEQISRIRHRMDTGTSTGNSRQISFGTAGIRTGHKPRLHGTFLLGDTTNHKARFGLWTDSNNHIIFETDQANNRWVCKCTNGGSSTTANISADFNRLQFLSIIVKSNTSVLFRHGQVSFGVNDIALGVFRFLSGTEQTLTTNIPTTSDMAPLDYIETLTNAAATLFTYDIQVLHSVYYDKP